MPGCIVIDEMYNSVQKQKRAATSDKKHGPQFPEKPMSSLQGRKKCDVLRIVQNTERSHDEDLGRALGAAYGFSVTPEVGGDWTVRHYASNTIHTFGTFAEVEIFFMGWKLAVQELLS